VPGKTSDKRIGFVLSNPQNGFEFANTHSQTPHYVRTAEPTIRANSHDPNERLAEMGSFMRIRPRSVLYNVIASERRKYE